MSLDHLIIMPFGKYKGKPIDQVSYRYLLWLYKQPWLKQNHSYIYNYIKRYKKDIELGASEEEDIQYELLCIDQWDFWK